LSDLAFLYGTQIDCSFVLNHILCACLLASRAVIDPGTASRLVKKKLGSWGFEQKQISMRSSSSVALKFLVRLGPRTAPIMQEV
jgi:hypothetical protein